MSLRNSSLDGLESRSYDDARRVNAVNVLVLRKASTFPLRHSDQALTRDAPTRALGFVERYTQFRDGIDYADVSVEISTMNATLHPHPVESSAEWRFKRFGLSRQESRVIELAMGGRIDKQIALEMGISLGTVRVYWKRIRSKTGGTRSESIAQMAMDSFKVDYDDLQRRAGDLQSQLDHGYEIQRWIKLYESIFEHLPIPFLIIDGVTSRVIQTNVSFAAMCGYKPTEIVGESVFTEPELAKAVLERVTVVPRTCRLAVRVKNGPAILRMFNVCGEHGAPVVLWASP